MEWLRATVTQVPGLSLDNISTFSAPIGRLNHTTVIATQSEEIT